MDDKCDLGDRCDDYNNRTPITRKTTKDAITGPARSPFILFVQNYRLPKKGGNLGQSQYGI
jgi:hypothetical protein